MARATTAPGLQFVHEPLPSSGSPIRLLNLHSGSESDPLECTLNHYPLHRLPSYSAVSYTWGSTEKLTHLTVNGKKCMVRRNLWLLLLHLRASPAPRTLWIDALCINQRDVEERNSQVSIMSVTYRQAENVVVWLGEAADDSDLAMELLNRTYYREVLLASQVDFYCGRYTISGDAALSLFQHLADKNPPQLRIHDYWRATSTICGAIEQTNASRLVQRRADVSACPRRNTLAELISQYHASACADIRDKIYALLGLVEDVNDVEKFRADYSKHPLRLYVEVVYFSDVVSLEQEMAFSSMVRDMLRINQSELDCFMYRPGYQFPALRHPCRLKLAHLDLYLYDYDDDSSDLSDESDESMPEFCVDESDSLNPQSL